MPFHRKINEDQQAEIIKLYQSGLTCQAIAAKLGYSYSGIHSLLMRNQIPRRAALKRQYLIDEDFLDNIDSNDKAYFLGWVFTDGCISRTGTIRISLQEKDVAVLESLRSLVGSNRPLVFKDYTNKLVALPRGKYGHRQNQYALNITNRKLWLRIQKLGCPPNKSKILQFPKWLPDCLFYAFMRGVIEGDGCIVKQRPMVRIYGTEMFLLGIKDKLLSLSGIESRLTKKDGVLKTLGIDKQEHALRLLSLVYDDVNLPFLERKRNIFFSHKMARCLT